MKPSTSKADGKKRKRDAPPVVLEGVKRSKVHAQRKFAQGTGTASPAISPIKDREKVKPRMAAPVHEPLLTNRVPTTGQFLDFLCFGRTSLLPPTLHYLRDASLSTPSTSSAPSPQLPLVNNTTGGKKEVKEKSDVDKQPAAVQALRKKYQEQRLAKQKATSVTTLAKKVKGKNMVRTRSAVVKEDVVMVVKSRVGIKNDNQAVVGLRSGLNRAQNAVAIVKAQKRRAKEAKLQRAGLRSGGKLDHPKTVAKEPLVSKNTKKKIANQDDKAKSVMPRRKIKQPSSGEQGSDFSSDDNEPLLTHKTPRTRSPHKRQMSTRSRGKDSEGIEKAGEARPSRRTKAAAALYMEEVSRKLACPSPHEDEVSSETFPELPKSRRDLRDSELKPPLTSKKVSTSKESAIKKNVAKKVNIKDGASPSRPSTRSTPSDEKAPIKAAVKPSSKAVIRDLIQKKKQMSLRTLSRMKNQQKGKPKDTSKNEENKEDITSEKKKDCSAEKKSDSESGSATRRLRGKTTAVEGPSEIVATEKPKKPKTSEGKAKDKQKSELGDVVPSKRPVRKCSTVDKMWIDVDGFTSDEEDFIDIESIALSANDKKPEAPTVNKGKCVKKASASETSGKEEPSTAPQHGPVSGAGNQTKGKKSDAKLESNNGGSLVKKTSTVPHVANTVVQREVLSVPPLADSITPKPVVLSDTAKTVSGRKLGNACITKLPDISSMSPPGAGTGAPVTTEKKVASQSCHLAAKISHQSVPEIIPKEASSVVPSLNTSLSLSPLKSPVGLIPTSHHGKGTIPRDGAPATSVRPVLPQADSHALIARLATSVSMTSKPSTFSLDVKCVTKDLKVIPTPATGMIKEEKISKAELKFSSQVVEPTEGSSDLEDKKSIVGLITSSLFSLKDQKTCPEKITESKSNSSVSHIKHKPETKVFKSEEISSLKPDSSLKTSPQALNHPALVACIADSAAIKNSESTINSEFEKSKITATGSRDALQKAAMFPKGAIGSFRKEEIQLVSMKSSREVLKTAKEKDEEKNEFKEKSTYRCGGASRTKPTRKTNNKREEFESSDDSVSSSERSGPGRGSAKRGRRPSPRAEVVTRRERPKRQCSATGKAWIDRDSDDSSFYDDGEEDVMELIRRSELALKKREEQARIEQVSSVYSKGNESDTFSESDDEPLMKKTFSAPSPSSPMTIETKETVFSAKNSGGKSEVPQECDIRAGTSGLGKVETLVFNERDLVPAPAVTFLQVPREPFNTHGLDLLSEVVAVADKSTARIEQWLKESQRADATKGFLGFEESEIRRPVLPTVSDAVLQFVRSSPSKPPTEIKRAVAKPEVTLKRPPVSSVTDLLKLQKERKESPKPSSEQHSKNCKCNSCVVKKAWFKNKPVPEDPKPAGQDASPPKPFQVLSQAFKEGTGAKASVSVAPFFQSRDEGKPAATTRKLSFLERMRERERKEALVKTPSQPFSPSNERSVYAFEPEAERQNAPLRSVQQPTRPLPRHAVRTSSSTSTSQEDDPDENRARHQSTSIAVQVNLDTSSTAPEPPPADDGKSFEISTQTEGDAEEPDSQMFYIPLQQTSGTPSSQQPLIQGVTVKLGTEGPIGPNQKVVMQAKLVTKPAQIPSMKAVVMPQQKLSESAKGSSGTTKNTPPVGTVQPTTRRPPGPLVTTRTVSPGSAQASSVRSGAKAQTPSVTSRGMENPLAASTPRLLKESPKPSSSTAPETQAATCETKESIMLMEAPTFHLTEKEFQDPLEFFERIRPAAERFGLCRIVPPTSFKPDCKVADDMRFTAYNQYVHRMLHRWGPSVQETMAIKKYLKTQCISLKPPPCVGGMEVDLPRLYQAVQTCGGLMKVMDKQKWQQVADLLRIPKAAHDRATKLDAIYCQYLLPYDTLQPEERSKLLEEVNADWAAHEAKMGVGSEPEADDEDEDYIEECEECIVKGRSMALNQFYRIARNTMSVWFKSPEPSPEDVEAEFWKHVTERKHHVCVHSGSIDSSGWGYGFPVGKNNFAKHPWNLKVLTNNSGSVLRSLGPVMGVTVPTLHVGMVFAAFCWYRDPHGLPWVEYLHTGAPKIWYGISDDNSTLFREALTNLLPKHIKEKRIWLPCDTAMAPPSRLAELGVPLSRTTQHPGQFVLVFPRAFTSSLCTGYLVSESVYFARPSWLQTAEQAFRDIHDSAEPSVFSLDNLLLSIAADARASLDILQQVLPMVRRLRERERNGRKSVRDLGVNQERLPRETGRRRGRSADPEPEHECEVCRASLFLSMVSNATEETVYCLKHGLHQLTSHPEQVASSKLLFSHDQDEINQIVEKLEERIDAKVLKNNKKYKT